MWLHSQELKKPTTDDYGRVTIITKESNIHELQEGDHYSFVVRVTCGEL